MPIDIFDNLPPYYEDVEESEQQREIENEDLNNISAELRLAFDRTFYLTADETAIKHYEDELGIVPGASDTLEDRRERLMALRRDRAQYTLPVLVSLLDGILGEGKYELELDYEEYTLILTDDGTHDKEIGMMMARILPCEIHFVHNTFPPARLWGFYGASFYGFDFYV